MKFVNKKTQETVEVTKKVFIDAYSHNSNWLKVEEKAQNSESNAGKSELTVTEIKKQLTELNVDFKGVTKKDELMALLEKAQNSEREGE